MGSSCRTSSTTSRNKRSKNATTMRLIVLPTRFLIHALLFLLAWCCASTTRLMTRTTTHAFVPVVSVGRHHQQHHQQHCTKMRPPVVAAAASDDSLPDFELPQDEERRREAERLQRQAEELRQQIRQAERELDASRWERQPPPPPAAKEPAPAVQDTGMSLRNRRVLVAGANGRLGSRVCRHLLRQHGSTVKEVVAAVHVVGENSPTARGYGRLAYEVGAEDGVGRIGPAWSEDRVQTFEYSGEIMDEYHLNKLRIVECELLDPVQCASIAEGVDCVIWCATDFNGNAPRAVSGLNIAFLFRAVADPTKGRVEIEGLQNMLGALKNAKQNRKRTSQLSDGAAAAAKEDDDPSEPNNFVLVSVAPDTLGNFETPFGEFNAIKREAEQNLKAFPSLSSTVLQMGKYEDNFVEEGQPLIFEKAKAVSEDESDNGKRKCINRRDAARAAVEALLDEELKGEIVQVYTAKR